jgi:NhaB family Na+:H+ antiporter
MQEQLDPRKIYNLIVQGLVGLWLIIGLALHLAEVGLIGLSVIVLLTALTGKIDENTIGHAFEEATPFTSLLVVFFVVVAMIEQNHLFTPVIQMALDTSPEMQPYVFFVFSGLLSAISDNVFVGTIYIKQAVANLGYASDQARAVAVAINVGTNIPSIATPNGQAAFLFLLTNAIAVRIKLSYLRMVVMAIPYFIVLTIVSLIFLQWYWIGGH